MTLADPSLKTLKWGVAFLAGWRLAFSLCSLPLPVPLLERGTSLHLRKGLLSMPFQAVFSQVWLYSNRAYALCVCVCVCVCMCSLSSSQYCIVYTFHQRDEYIVLIRVSLPPRIILLSCLHVERECLGSLYSFSIGALGHSRMSCRLMAVGWLEALLAWLSNKVINLCITWENFS